MWLYLGSNGDNGGAGVRAAHGEAMHVMDWMEVRRWWRTSTAGERGNGDYGAARLRESESEAERESENGREQQHRLHKKNLYFGWQKLCHNHL